MKKSEYDKKYKLRKLGKIELRCIICNKKLPNKQGKYCDKLFFTGTRTYNKDSCAYKARAKHHLRYNKKRIEYFRKWGVKNYRTRPEIVFKSYRYNSNLKGRNFNISFDYFMKYWGKDCYYCGESNCFGVDRLNNKIGYEEGNIVSCCSKCNFAKGYRLSSDEFIELAKKIADHNAEKEKSKSL